MEEGLGFSSGGGGGSECECCEERNEGREPRKAESQCARLGETSKSLDDKTAICWRRACARGNGGRSDSKADEETAAEAEAEAATAEEEGGRLGGCWICCWWW